MAEAEVAEEFRKIGDKYGWEPSVVKWMIAAEGLAARSINDFIFSVSDEAGVSAIVEGITVNNRIQQVSRVRQAWRALRKAIEDAEVVKRQGELNTDLDKLLTQPELEGMAEKHYQRYKLTWPPEVTPGDLLVSRLAREIQLRQLSFREVWKIRTQAFQQKAQRKKIKLTDNLDLLQDEAEDDNVLNHDVHGYLEGLFTLLLAYSMAGIQSVQGAPSVESRGTDTTLVVQCPLDILLRYYHRAQDRAHKLPRSMSLEWIKRNDEADRMAWVDKYRNSKETLGSVIHTVLIQREALWVIPEVLPTQAAMAPNRQQGFGSGKGGAASQPPGGGGGKGDRKRKRSDEPKGGSKGKSGGKKGSKGSQAKSAGGQWASRFADGKPLCRN